MIEALACQCPCIAYACETGPDEIIIPDVNGILVEPENVIELSRAIDRLNSDRGLLKKYKKNSQLSVQHLSSKAIAQEWLKLIPERK